MKNLYVVSEYKNRIINLLLQNQDFIKLIAPDMSDVNGLDCIDMIVGGDYLVDGKVISVQGNIFDYNFVEDTITEKKTFVFVESQINTIRHNLIADFDIYICVFTHKSLVRLTDITQPTVTDVKHMGYFTGNYGNRIDILVDVIDRTVTGSPKIHGIGTLQPAEFGFLKDYVPNRHYYGKCLRYCIKNIHDNGGDFCGS